MVFFQLRGISADITRDVTRAHRVYIRVLFPKKSTCIFLFFILNGRARLKCVQIADEGFVVSQNVLFLFIFPVIPWKIVVRCESSAVAVVRNITLVVVGPKQFVRRSQLVLPFDLA